ncbi:MAG: tetrahydromethanopterin S-methyltransferase subunit H [Candidatus Bathyarchaeia archaeon]
MFRFNVEQKRFRIGDVEIGGEPGRRPICLIGSIFYSREKLHLDEDKGEFNREEAERLISLQEEFSDKTGNPCMLDVVGSTADALVRHLEFAAAVTDMPLLVDGVTADIRIEAVKVLKELGLGEPLIYNSLTPDFKAEELRILSLSGIDAAVILTFSSKAYTSKGRVELAEKTLEMVGEAVKRPLVDTAVLDIPSLGSASKALMEVKDRLGLPVGCGAHNAVETWRGLKSKMGLQARDPSLASASVIAACFGADFILYGPIEHAPKVFPAVAMVDAALGYLSFEDGIRPKPPHPLFKIA